MSQYQLIALDMDGTLLNSRKEISAGNLKAIEKASTAGKAVVLSTGRCRPELKEFYDRIPGLRYLDCSSGAMIYDLQEKKVLYSCCLDTELVKKLIQLGRMEEAMLHLMGEEAVVERDQMAHMERYGMKIYQPMYEAVMTPCEDAYQFFCEHPMPIEKFNLYHKSVESRERTKERIKKAGYPVTVADAESGSLEITALGTDKGTGLLKLCEALEISVSQTIAVGDADNDISILKTAGLDVAMGNADPHVKEIADVVTADCDHDGCAEIIYNYLLG